LQVIVHCLSQTSNCALINLRFDVRLGAVGQINVVLP
jgi:hypothetical protein